jgi:putative transposase
MYSSEYASVLVSGHGFSHADAQTKMIRALAPVMARPVRHSLSEQIPSHKRTFFATTRTSLSRRVFQSELNALLLVDILRSCVAAKEFLLHDFVIMPDHVHLLLTVDGKTTIERAMQLIKGRFSYRIKKETGYLGEVWQGGYSEVRVEDQESYSKHVEYIAQNPVKAGLVDSPEQYPFCFSSLAKKKAQGLKPSSV